MSNNGFLFSPLWLKIDSIITNLSHNVSESEINNIQVIPIEDDFGSGTAHSHFEEGYDETNGVISHEPRYINGIFHPTLMSFLSNEKILLTLQNL